ncbi:glycoside hydrolase family 43 protein [Asticcacaulis sp. AC402]|uniref:glycoside hydrolase family 43 protein n=1 Tax=Asticcacaulis sp. AC402 TaxID=1282361 RepID=UPI0003C3B6EB|nr:glycoside hydrolase family 43 protein [Asticcacaulis sp. AC402]ESQ76715.1 xylan 1,4-beta-xylosidase [Asticcacaulis sp. AC402]
MRRTIALTALAVILSTGQAAAQSQAVFTDTVLRGSHMVDQSYPLDVPEKPGYYRNPILPGYSPDPSIHRVGDTYYMVNSTFAHFPGIPVWKSTDLVNWTQIGNAIDRPGMLDFSGLGISRGVFAPAISYHEGTFYIVNTCVDCKGQFVITATDPAGPWSDPVWLPFGGIDPSIFFDDDGKAYITWNDGPIGEPEYDGHRAIWMQQFDPKTLSMVGEKKMIVNGGADFSQKPIWIEGPHIYKINGWYYLMPAEGGTAEGHSQVVFRTKNVWGPYEPWEKNPILTQRDLPRDRPNPITSAGHADLVQTPQGEWYAIFLAVRPYGDDLYNTGRETFLLPVKWVDGWPVILDRGKVIPLSEKRPKGLGDAPQASPHYQDISGYDPLKWLSIRGPSDGFLSVSNGGKVLTLKALSQPIGDVNANPAFVGLRQQSNFTAMDTKVAFTPNEGDRAGLLAVQSDDAWVFCGVTKRNGVTEIALIQRASADDPRDGVVLNAQPVDAKDGVHVTLGVRREKLYCMYNPAADHMKTDKKRLAWDADATVLSTRKAGGFVGTIIGPYAYSQKP